MLISLDAAQGAAIEVRKEGVAAETAPRNGRTTALRSNDMLMLMSWIVLESWMLKVRLIKNEESRRWVGCRQCNRSCHLEKCARQSFSIFRIRTRT